MNMEYSNVVLFGVFTDAKNYTMDGLATINSSQLIEKSQLRTTKPNDAYLSGFLSKISTKLYSISDLGNIWDIIKDKGVRFFFNRLRSFNHKIYY